MKIAARVLVATTLVLAFGVGCGSAGGGGCGGLKPLPKDPQPLGFPTDQIIEGGLQARVTKPGMDKLIATVTSLISNQLANNPFCVPTQQQGGSALGARECAQSCGSSTGCPVKIELQSADGKDKIVATLPDTQAGAPPIVHIDASFDVNLPILVQIKTIFTGWNDVCTLDAYDEHFKDTTKEPIHITADVALGVDQTTGYLTIHLDQLKILNLGLRWSDCGIASTILDFVTQAIDGVITSFIGDFIINLLKPQLDALLQGFLPKPPGIAGVLDTGSILRNFDPPKDTNLEVHVVAGGYVASKAGGLTLGVVSGFNSDRDETTRSPGFTSEPSLCVPARPTPDLAAAPWKLPFNTGRNDFLLSPANEFSGTPDPVDGSGNLRDVAIGVSRTFLDLAGFHIFNSGTLCLAIGGSALPQLNAGTLSVIVGSLGNILEDRKGPLALVLRPQTPISFTLGAGDMNDPLLHVALSDLRIDFYAWIEERYVRLLTMAVDLNVGLNLTVAKDPMTMKPGIQPMLVGVDASNVTIRISNTDLLQEDPKALEKVFPSLINIATGALGGAIKPIALPSVQGFTLDDLAINKVQTSQDDFLGIFGTLKSGTPDGLIDWSDPAHPKRIGQLTTRATLARVDVPPPSVLKAMVATGAPQLAAIETRPRVTLALDAEGNQGHPVEWAWRIDNGFWRPWTEDAHPVVAAEEFLLQGHHVMEVRSRVVGEWVTEDLSPAKLDVIIDSVAPEVHPALDDKDHNRVAFNGFDLVSETNKLVYAWRDLDGNQTAWTPSGGITVAQARDLTRDFAVPLVIFARDEAGNISSTPVDLGPLVGFHGRTTDPPKAGGCGCTVGGAADGNAPLAGLVVVLFGLAVLLRGRSKALASLIVVALAGTLVAGCGCSGNGLQCSVDDDCAKMACAAGQIPQCQSNMCLCTPDVPAGDIGRFASMTLIGPQAYVAAYNNMYGDLMIGHLTPPGVVTDWDYVDGVPDEAPTYANSHVRGGVQSKGDDVGRYTSIQSTPQGEPIIAYYDKTHGALKFASFGVIRWRSHTVDKGTGVPEGTGDDVGRWASMSLDTQGRPGIAYFAKAVNGTKSGMPEGQLRFAQAKVPDPQMAEDWDVTVLDTEVLPGSSMAPPGDGGAPDGGAPTGGGDELLPEGTGLMAALARKLDGTPAVAYYDRTRGNLKYVEYSSQQGKWGTPVILDGEAPNGKDTADVGLYPSLTFDEKEVGNISYEDATHDNLLFVNTATKTPEVVDDGYRPADEMTQDGLASPVFHLVGDSSSVATTSGVVAIAYQDSTTLQLRLAQKGQDGKWQLQTVAGHMMPFKGAYGFYANLRVSNQKGVISSYAINQHPDTPLFFVEVFSVNLGLIM